MVLKLTDNSVFVFSLRRFITLAEVLMQHLNHHTELKTHVKDEFHPRTRHEGPEGE
jgi:hypothetical protein